MTLAGAAGAPLAALGVYLAVTIAERIGEIALSARNAKRLERRGGVEQRGAALFLVVTLHVAYPIALAWEVLVLGARPPSVWSALLALYVAAEALRLWAIVTLGDRWNIRIWSMPHESPVTRGPYVYLRHPNYVAVVVQLAVGPLLFGAWRTAVAASAVNVLVLALRVPNEERALGLRP